MKISGFFLKYNGFERFVIFNDLGFLRRTGEWQAGGGISISCVRNFSLQLYALFGHCLFGFLCFAFLFLWTASAPDHTTVSKRRTLDIGNPFPRPRPPPKHFS